MSEALPGGIVYTETMIHSAPEAFASQAPYQIAIITLNGGGRITARLSGEAVRIGDAVGFLEYRDGIPFFRKSS
ncbi:MAG: OB-fold domain-containing protein [Acidobacteriia bacterium]|nr:OB-fold domain-containing protein [Terriglobia bacterium]